MGEPAAAPAWSVADREVAAVIDWWAANPRPLPWRTSRDVYAIWVSEAMSTQTTVTRAAEAWTRWMARWPTVQALAGASLTEVLSQWQGLGYPRRARDLHRSARIVVRTGCSG
jgi:A/G-specific adenine glycosylase